MHQDAIAAHERLAEVFAWNKMWGSKWPLAHSYALAGRRDEALQIVAELEAEEVNAWSAFGLAVVYAALGDKDKAFRWLAFERPHAWLPWIRVFPWFRSLWDDSRFLDLLNKLNLPPPQ